MIWHNNIYIYYVCVSLVYVCGIVHWCIDLLYWDVMWFYFFCFCWTLWDGHGDSFFFTQKILFDVLNVLWYFMIMFHRRYCLWNFGFGARLPGVTSSALYWSSRLSGSIPEIFWGFGAAQALIDMAILTLWQSAESKCCMLIFAVGFKALHCNV